MDQHVCTPRFVGSQWFLLTTLALLSINQSSSAQGAEQARCRYAPWSPLRSVFAGAGSRATVARGASLTAIGATTYIAGNDIPFLSPDTIRESPLAVARLGGHGIGRPAGNFRFVNPKLLADRRGRVHLLWGEPADASARIAGVDWTSQKITRIWTALYEAPRGWSPARKVYGGPEIDWAEATSTDGDGHLDRAAVVATVNPNRAWPGVVAVFRLKGDSLVSSSADVFATPAYHVLTSVGPTVYLAFVASVRDVLPGKARRNDNNSVWLQRSLNGGVTWEKEILVSRSGEEPAHKLRLHVTPDAHVHLIWRKDYPGGTNVIRHVESGDGGRTWSAPDDLHPSQSPFSNLHSVVDACGALQLVNEYMDPNTGEARLEVAIWDGRWSRVERLEFPGQRVGGVSLYRAPDGRLDLALLSALVAAPPATPPTMSYAERGRRTGR